MEASLGVPIFGKVTAQCRALLEHADFRRYRGSNLSFAALSVGATAKAWLKHNVTSSTNAASAP